MSTATAVAEPAVAVVSAEERFLFDLQGFILLKGVLSPEECQRYLGIVEDLESRSFDDQHIRDKVNLTDLPSQPTLDRSGGAVRLNGLLRMDPAFHNIIAHPRVAPYLEAFMQGPDGSDGPQLGNTWSISKFKGTHAGGWHRGASPFHYSYRNGRIFTSMLNTVWFLTDNGPDDGCMVALPGGHKSNIELDFGRYPGMSMPGAQMITGKAGDVFMFSETVMHNGLGKTSSGRRTNLYYNYFSRGWGHTMESSYHYCMPPSIRSTFTPKQRTYTQWMQHTVSV